MHAIKAQRLNRSSSVKKNTQLLLRVDPFPCFGIEVFFFFFFMGACMQRFVWRGGSSFCPAVNLPVTNDKSTHGYVAVAATGKER